MTDAKVDMALDDIIKKSRGGQGNRRGRGRGGYTLNSGMQRRQRGGNNNQRGNRGRIGNNNNRGRGGNNGGFRRGGRNSFSQRNNNRSNNFRQQRGNGNSFAGFNRRNFGGDKPTATYNPLSRDDESTTSKQQQQQQTQPIPRKQQGSVFNKIRKNPAPVSRNVGALRRRMVAAQHALSRATKTLASMPRLKQQRQRFLQQPQQLRNIITRNKLAGGAIRKRLSTGRTNIRGKTIGRGGARRMFV